MADVFLSYASEDRDRVIALVAALEARGLSVWWDRDIGIGASYDQEIERQLNDARCVIVVWSSHAIGSDWVKNEAQEGYDRGVLVPVRIDDVRPPLAFRRLQTADLRDGSDSASTAMAGMLASVLALVGREASARPEERQESRRAGLSGRRLGSLAIAGAAVTVVVLLILIYRDGVDRELPRYASLAIEPFTAVGDDDSGRWSSTATADLRSAFSATAVELVVADDPAAVTPDVRLTGTVRAEGEELFVSIELSATRDGEVIWADTLNPTRKDRWRSGFPQAGLIALMVERSLDIARYRQHVLAEGHMNPQAVDAFLDGLTETNKIEFRLGGNWRVAVGLFERAAQLEPDSPFIIGRVVAAYVGRLGDSITAAEARSTVAPYLARLHDLGSPAEVGFWQGLVDLHLNLDYAAAEAALDSAMVPEALLEVQRCWLECMRGDIGRAIRHCDAAVSASPDPQSLQVQGMVLLFAGRYGDARRTLTRSLESSGAAGGSVVSVLKTYAEVFDGDPQAARQTIDAARLQYGDEDPSLFIAPYALLGDTVRAEQLLQDALQRDRNGTRQLVGVSSIFRGLFQLGRLDEAFEYLDRAIDNREGTLVCALRSDPTLQALRQDPRYALALSRLEAIERSAGDSH